MGGGFDAKDLAEAAECFGFPVPEIDVVTGTGVVAPFVNASPETHLDLITAASVLTAADRITLLQVVDPLTGLTDAFERMLEGAEVPDVASLSYGACEAEFAESVGDYLTLNEDLLRMAAIVGTTVVAAAGDYGSSMCGAEYAAESGEPSVWYPSSSAWVTSVGGTRLVLKPDNSRRSERVWNDLPYTGDWPAPAPAGSGGASSLIERPWWQAGSTPAGPRSVPDVALLGAVRPGWPIVYGGDLFTVGGTSGGTPFLAANLAAMSAKQRERGYPTIGFSNAWLYAAAASTKSPYFDIQDGTNGVQLVGCCSAYPGYDMASGLGVPDMDLLYATLKRPAG
jgi:subtilase family serine protease